MYKYIYMRSMICDSVLTVNVCVLSFDWPRSDWSHSTAETWMQGNQLGKPTGVKGHLRGLIMWVVVAMQCKQERRNLCLRGSVDAKCACVSSCWTLTGWEARSCPPTCLTLLLLPVRPQRPRSPTWHTDLIALSVFCVKISPKPAPLSWTVNLAPNHFAFNLINMGGIFPYDWAWEVWCYAKTTSHIARNLEVCLNCTSSICR